MHLAAAEHSRRLLLLYGVVEMARESAHPQYGRARDAYDLLASIEQQAPEHADAVLQYPSVGAWAIRTLRALRGGQSPPEAAPAGLATVAASAAIKARYPCAIEVPVSAGAVMFPSLGQASLPEALANGGRVLVRSGDDGAEFAAGRRRSRIPAVPHLNAPGWMGLRQVSSRWRDMAIRLVIDDLDPYRMRAPMLGARLTAEQADEWESCLRSAWRVLCQHHRGTAEELGAAIKVLVPLKATAPGMRSATSLESFGCIGISPAVSPLLLAVAFAHEVQHAKLSALLNFVRLTNPDDGRRYYAPWREDPRPVGGLLQGAYAYLGVAGFWRLQRHQEAGAAALQAHAEYARWRSAVFAVASQLLESGQLTTTGRAFVSAIEATVQAWQSDPVPLPAAEMARSVAKSHAERWRARYGRGIAPATLCPR
jgi:HEXXH motif-containing protein